MDLVNYSEKVFSEIQLHIEDISIKLDIKDVRFIPISALHGDNVVERSKKMNWYDGPTLMYYLENVHIRSDINYIDFRFPVQYVIRPQSDEFHDYRGYAGRIASGIINKGDKVTALPSGMSASVKSIDTMKESSVRAFAPQSVVLTLEDDIDIGRGDMIVKEGFMPEISQDIELMICWLSEKPMILNGKYGIKHTTSDARCIIKDLVYKININTLEENKEDKILNLNEIAKIKIRTTKPLFYDSYHKNRITGSIILIDEGTNNTVGAGMIV
jgi:sulfate adenylyltransferase subunit 1